MITNTHDAYKGILRQGQIALNEERFEEAFSSFREAEDALIKTIGGMVPDENLSLNLVLQAKALYALGRAEQAESAYVQALQFLPQESTIVRARVELEYAQFMGSMAHHEDVLWTKKRSDYIECSKRFFQNAVFLMHVHASNLETAKAQMEYGSYLASFASGDHERSFGIQLMATSLEMIHEAHADMEKEATLRLMQVSTAYWWYLLPRLFVLHFIDKRRVVVA